MNNKIQKDDECDLLDFEEDLIQKQDKKLKKHYLKPTSKAFINKFKKLFKNK